MPIMPIKRSAVPSKPKRKKPVSLWYVYMVRCADGSLYTGITTEVTRRVAEHIGPKAAKYTRARQPVVLVYKEMTKTRSTAAVREAALKKLPRTAKETLILDTINLTR